MPTYVFSRYGHFCRPVSVAKCWSSPGAIKLNTSVAVTPLGAANANAPRSFPREIAVALANNTTISSSKAAEDGFPIGSRALVIDSSRIDEAGGVAVVGQANDRIDQQLIADGQAPASPTTWMYLDELPLYKDTSDGRMKLYNNDTGKTIADAVMYVYVGPIVAN